MKDNTIEIKAYQQSDRPLLRQICCDVADRGSSVEALFFDREIAADLLLNYYLEYEPEAVFMAFRDGKLVGYLTGCCDNRRWGLVMGFILIPCLIFKAVGRGVFLHRQTWQMLKVALSNWQRAFAWRKNEFNSHQGHFHIGVIAQARGTGVGKALLQAFVAKAQQAGVRQLIASVHGLNKAACSFFARHHFIVVEDHLMRAWRNGKAEAYHALIYEKNI